MHVANTDTAKRIDTAKNRRLSPDDLVALAERMVASKDPQEIERLKKEMERGFYGDADNRKSLRRVPAIGRNIFEADDVERV